jgi:ABC-type Mn2+/Zn2+ transport system ATPase subunit
LDTAKCGTKKEENVIISKLKRENIFCNEFENLTENNEVNFSRNNIAVIYGPNGTGKTSLARVLEQENNSEYTIQLNDRTYTEQEGPFVHIIHDQNGRNIIEGSTEDFILGDNIKKEYELKRTLDMGFDSLYSNLINLLKTKYGISTKSAHFLNFITDDSLKGYISDLANNKQKGKNISKDDFLHFFSSKSLTELDNSFDEEKFSFFVEDLKSKTSCLKALEQIPISSFCKENEYEKIEQTDDAVQILEKYPDIHNCIVCDTQIDYDGLLTKKKEQNQHVHETLSQNSKDIIEKVISIVPTTDKFDIKQILVAVFTTGNLDELKALLSEVNLYKNYYNALIENAFIENVKGSGLLDVYAEYSKIVSGKLEFEDEDVLFIEKFLNSCLERKISLSRDENKNIHLLLGNEEFLNQQRTDLMLSNGEQNFLSLSFELLKAKKVDKELIVLDDPISSFDSIYKNKIAYAIIKFLNTKKSLVLTHNTDLIKLLEHQAKDCFTLYYMNNTIGETNGFLHINKNEIKILLYIPDLINLFRDGIEQEIIDEKAFLISVIPFIRGYCLLTNDNTHKEKLTKLMHGYESESEELSEIYNTVFSTSIIKNKYTISANDILNYDIDNLKIIKKDNYPLLSKTLLHSFTYLYLRMSVEKKLVDKFSINTKKHDMLSSIIYHSFHSDTKENIENRIFFLSKKTLLNEFNHFEMDMNIFQPAIDITNLALAKEKKEILAKLESL